LPRHLVALTPGFAVCGFSCAAGFVFSDQKQARTSAFEVRGF